MSSHYIYANKRKLMKNYVLNKKLLQLQSKKIRGFNNKGTPEAEQIILKI